MKLGDATVLWHFVSMKQVKTVGNACIQYACAKLRILHRSDLFQTRAIKFPPRFLPRATGRLI
jgi:hypothetical protein